MDDGIEFRDGTATLRLGGRPAARLEAGAVEAVWLLRQDPLVHEDEPLTVIAAGPVLWLVPWPTRGAGAFLAALAARPGVAFRGGVLTRVPLQWRARLLGVLPLFPTPRLAERPARELPAIEAAHALDPGAVLELYAGQEA
jgi:hypothetical protein